MARSYRRLASSARRQPVLNDDPTFEDLSARFVRYQESRNLSENTLRVYDQAFR